jgi:hypothetical protein
LAPEEAEYLQHERDLVTLSPAGDNATALLEDWIEDIIIRMNDGRRFQQVGFSSPAL